MRAPGIFLEGYNFLRLKSWSPRVRKRTGAGVILPGFARGPPGGFRETGFPARDENLPARQESGRGRQGLAFWNTMTVSSIHESTGMPFAPSPYIFNSSRSAFKERKRRDQELRQSGAQGMCAGQIVSERSRAARKGDFAGGPNCGKKSAAP